MAEPKTISVVVAFVADAAKRVLLAWNDKWGGFTLPMTKPDAGPPVETDDAAALRVAAETLRVPVRLVAGRTARKTRELLLGGRDSIIKNYVYTVVPVEIHPDFAAALPAAPLWVAPRKIEEGEYGPLTDSVQPLFAEFREWRWI